MARKNPDTTVMSNGTAVSKYYSGLRLDFSKTLHNWAAQSAQQLRDTYRLQKVWDMTRSNSVWEGRNVTHTWNGKKYVVHNWYDEVQYRKQRDIGSGDQWYSTGTSYMIAMGNPVTVKDDSPQHGVVDFHTTMGALFAEAGVGLNGRFKVRGSRSRKGRERIKVDRKKPYSFKDRTRYTEWVPGVGKSHRPSTRQQVNLLTRRLKWAAKTMYNYELSTYIAYTLESQFHMIGNISWDIDPKTLVPVGRIGNWNSTNGTTYKQLTWEQYLKRSLTNLQEK